MHNRWHLYDELVDSVPSKELVKSFVYGDHWLMVESDAGGVGMAQPSHSWPDVQHELGGARVYYVTKEYWDTTVAEYLQQLTGVNIQTPVPDDLWEKNSGTIRMPADVNV